MAPSVTAQRFVRASRPRGGEGDGGVHRSKRTYRTYVSLSARMPARRQGGTWLRAPQTLDTPAGRRRAGATSRSASWPCSSRCEGTPAGSTRSRSPSARSPASTPTPSPPSTGRPAARSRTSSGARRRSRPRRWRSRSARGTGSSGSSTPIRPTFATRGGVGRRLLRRRVRARPAHGAAPDRQLRDALGALAERGAVRPLERAREPAEPRGAAAAHRPPRRGARRRARPLPASDCATGRPSATSPRRSPAWSRASG